MTEFASLSTLAAKGSGGLLIAYGHNRWSYPGASTGTGAKNLRLPDDSVGQPEIDAALADGAWVVAGRGSDGKPTMVTEAGSALAVRPEIQPA